MYLTQHSLHVTHDITHMESSSCSSCWGCLTGPVLLPPLFFTGSYTVHTSTPIAPCVSGRVFQANATWWAGLSKILHPYWLVKRWRSLPLKIINVQCCNHTIFEITCTSWVVSVTHRVLLIQPLIENSDLVISMRYLSASTQRVRLPTPPKLLTALDCIIMCIHKKNKYPVFSSLIKDLGYIWLAKASLDNFTYTNKPLELVSSLR